MINQLQGVPAITVDLWEGRPFTEREFRETLALFAYRARKPVRVSRFSGQFEYSPSVIHIYVKAGHVIDESNIAGQRVYSDSENLAAIVHHNSILILSDITIEEGQARLAEIALRCLDHLDFSKPASEIAKEKALKYELRRCADNFARQYLDEKRSDLSRLQAEIDDLNARLAFSAGMLPKKRAEMRAAERLAKRLPHTVERREFRRIRDLVDAGLYESVSLIDEGIVVAQTSEIDIHYDGYRFPLGAYRIELSPPARIRIDALDDHPFANHPHPHVATDGRPCLGNIHNTAAKLLGGFRVGEALQLLHTFLSSYSPDNPYERIGSFDPDQMFNDEDECEDCDDRSSPYCICQCERNDGRFEIEDCYDYRSDYCYLECSHRGNDCADLSPCDDCNELKNCFHSCVYNQSWAYKDPCQECEDNEGCDRCEHAPKARALGKEIHVGGSA